MTTPQHIAVLMGGWSPERDVSLQSGTNCANALREAGYKVSEVDAGRDLAQILTVLAPDVVFNALHGIGGEDGVVQGVLETLGLAYTHSGVLASALAMDKVRAKKFFASVGLTVAPDKLLTKGHCTAHPFEPPYVVKPVNQGSSVGVSLVKQGDDFPDYLTAQGWAFDGAVMAECFVSGREMTCAVMGDKALGVMEIIPTQGFYDYTAKYQPRGAQHIMPANIDDDLRTEIRHAALAAHQVLGCRGMTRTDFRLDESGLGLVVLEINTQPGMTSLSLVPEIAAHEGISYVDMVRWMVEDASCQR